LSGGLAILRGSRPERFALDRGALPPVSLDQVNNVDRGVTAYDDVLTARSDRVPGADRDGVVACVAHHLEPTYGAGAVQVPVVQTILGHDVVVETPQILVGEELAGEESRPAEAFEPVARAPGLAAAACMVGDLANRGVE